MSDVEIIFIPEELVGIIDNLVDISETPEFPMLYKNIPFSYYYTIEQLSFSRSSVNKELCTKARLITNKFHKSIK